MDTKTIEAAARALCSLDGHEPDVLSSFGHNNSEMNERLGFKDITPYKQGLWVDYIPEAARILTVLKVSGIQ